ncbi:hypothetical protein [Nocardia sp. NPDC004750]
MIKDGTDGSVVITTPDENHTIEPGTPLTVAVPSQYQAGEGALRNLHATEVTRP